jgi:hypothetical protein
VLFGSRFWGELSVPSLSNFKWWNLWSSVFLQIPRFPMLVLASLLTKNFQTRSRLDIGSRSAYTTHIWDWTLCRYHYCAANESGLLTKKFTIYSYFVSPCTCDYKTFVSSSGIPCFACNLPPSSCYMCFLVSALNRSVDINWRLDSSKDLFLITWKVPLVLPETSSCMLWSVLTSSNFRPQGKSPKDTITLIVP